ncbi:MAG TPA: citrate synthase family protein [Candidatus Kapabacteria bacterium]|nr:citrate synthase family protein [Candidatus Kapabacteria bacterium]
MKSKRYLSAQEAARELGITPATLYSYVSRGLIRSEQGSGTGRERRYHAEDIRKLKERSQVRRDPAKATEGALHWGAPLLESSITLIADGRLYYRGEDAVRLAATRSLEEVAGLIWNGDMTAPIPFNAHVVRLPARLARMQRALAELRTIERMQTVLAIAAAEDHAAYDLRTGGVIRTGMRIVQLMTAVAADVPTIGGGIAAALAAAWAPGKPQAARLLERALILAADHELNVSSFTVRCVASAGSTPYQAVIAGLAALEGTKHGGYTERVEAMLEEIGKPERTRDQIAARLRRGEVIPGFGHSLYPEGDPRGAALLDAVADAMPRSQALKLPFAVRDAAADMVGDYPTIDLGLVAISRALALPPGTPLALFALGRTIGWIGHALEQYATDRMIRPRARYTGKTPGE